MDASPLNASQDTQRKPKKIHRALRNRLERLGHVPTSESLNELINSLTSDLEVYEAQANFWQQKYLEITRDRTKLEPIPSQDPSEDSEKASDGSQNVQKPKLGPNSAAWPRTLSLFEELAKASNNSLTLTSMRHPSVQTSPSSIKLSTESADCSFALDDILHALSGVASIIGIFPKRDTEWSAITCIRPDFKYEKARNYWKMMMTPIDTHPANLEFLASSASRYHPNTQRKGRNSATLLSKRAVIVEDEDGSGDAMDLWLRQASDFEIVDAMLDMAVIMSGLAQWKVGSSDQLDLIAHLGLNCQRLLREVLFTRSLSESPHLLAGVVHSIVAFATYFIIARRTEAFKTMIVLCWEFAKSKPAAVNLTLRGSIEFLAMITSSDDHSKTVWYHRLEQTHKVSKKSGRYFHLEIVFYLSSIVRNLQSKDQKKLLHYVAKLEAIASPSVGALPGILHAGNQNDSNQTNQQQYYHSPHSSSVISTSPSSSSDTPDFAITDATTSAAPAPRLQHSNLPRVSDPTMNTEIPIYNSTSSGTSSWMHQQSQHNATAPITVPPSSGSLLQHQCGYQQHIQLSQQPCPNNKFQHSDGQIHLKKEQGPTPASAASKMPLSMHHSPPQQKSSANIAPNTIQYGQMQNKPGSSNPSLPNFNPYPGDQQASNVSHHPRFMMNYNQHSAEQPIPTLQPAHFHILPHFQTNTTAVLPPAVAAPSPNLPSSHQHYQPPYHSHHSHSANSHHSAHVINNYNQAQQHLQSQSSFLIPPAFVGVENHQHIQQFSPPHGNVAMYGLQNNSAQVTPSHSQQFSTNTFHDQTVSSTISNYNQVPQHSQTDYHPHRNFPQNPQFLSPQSHQYHNQQPQQRPQGIHHHTQQQSSLPNHHDPHFTGSPHEQFPVPDPILFNFLGLNVPDAEELPESYDIPDFKFWDKARNGWGLNPKLVPDEMFKLNLRGYAAMVRAEVAIWCKDFGSCNRWIDLAVDLIISSAHPIRQHLLMGEGYAITSQLTAEFEGPQGERTTVLKELIRRIAVDPRLESQPDQF